MGGAFAAGDAPAVPLRPVVVGPNEITFAARLPARGRGQGPWRRSGTA
jgi:hypothetical protein